MKDKLFKSQLSVLILFTRIAFFTIFILPSIAFAAPNFSKVFTPNNIGPGSVSTITFTITNVDSIPLSGLAFTDVLPTAPGDVDIATPANASTTCLDGVVTAPAGGGTVSLSMPNLALVKVVL